MTNIFRHFISKTQFYILFFPWTQCKPTSLWLPFWRRSRQQRCLHKLTDDRGFTVHHYNRNVSFSSLTEEGIVSIAEMTLLFELYCLLLWLIIATMKKTERNTSGSSVFPCIANSWDLLHQIFILFHYFFAEITDSEDVCFFFFHVMLLYTKFLAFLITLSE